MSSDNRSGIGAWLTLLGSTLLLVAHWLLWLAGQLSSVFAGRGWPDSSPVDAFNLIPALIAGDLTRAWPPAAAAVLGSTRQIYLIFAVLLVLAIGVAAVLVWAGFAWRRRRGFRWGRLGFASGWEIRQQIGYRALLKRAPTTRPALAGRSPINPLEVGYYLGRDVRSRRRVYSSVADPVLIVGPPRTGKDSQFVTPFTIDAPGACIVVSSQLESFTTTYAARAKLGKVYVFDPDNITGWPPPERIKMTFIHAAVSPTGASDMAQTMTGFAGYHIGGERSPGHEASYFSATAAVIILRSYLLTAALHGRTLIDVVRWSRNPLDPEPLTLLRQAEAAGVAPRGWATEFEGLTRTNQEARTAMWAVVAQSLRFLHNREVLEQFSPGPDEQFDLASFLSGRNTLYILAKDRGDHPVTPGLSILLGVLVMGAARGVAANMPGGRLEPPLTVEFNEAESISPFGNMAMDLMRSAGRASIATHIYVKSLSSMMARYGEGLTRDIWDSAAYRVILGEGGNIDDLQTISRLIGEVRRPPAITDAGHNDDMDPILTPEDLRTLKLGRAVVLGRNARPVEIKLTPWWKRPDGAAIAASKREIEQRIFDLTQPGESRVDRYIEAHLTGGPPTGSQPPTGDLSTTDDRPISDGPPPAAGQPTLLRPP
jgi:type IV secretory pathway TraG/TraD family ATPase VirD4